MIGYFFLLQVFVSTLVQASPHHLGEKKLISDLTQNDANLNAGFDIEAFRTDQLNLHNYYRAKHGVPAMTRSQTLTNQAQAFAERLAAIAGEKPTHCSEMPDCDNHGAGENLAMALDSTDNEVNATKGWYEEVWDYNYCHNKATFNRPGHEGEDTGHFTQVVWKTSTELGIGYARSSDKTKVYAVGRYFEPGNIGGEYGAKVPKAQYLFDTFQDNCDGTNGGFSGWSAPGDCSRSCCGGVKFQTRTCTNPKPSLNGRDCDGDTRRLASKEWCNLKKCAGDASHREQQCEARGYTAKANNFGGSHDCVLHCFSSGNTYTNRGDVDDGTHCNSDSGVCVSGVCIDMPDYAAPTTPPPTNAAGSITGSYTGTPSSDVFDNDIFEARPGATNLVITNRNLRISIKVGYKYQREQSYRWGESSRLNKLVAFYGEYTTTRTVAGVSFDYKRTPKISTITITGPVQPTSGYTLVLYVEGNSHDQADISWSYTA